jgi:peptidoglycan hydrolase CwlO-like protein
MQTGIMVMMFSTRLVMGLDSEVAMRDLEKNAKNRPVTKVINLLKDMTTQLEKEAEEDKEIYETMGCWCVTNEKAKTKSIGDSETEIETLTASIESLTAMSGKLNTEIGNLNEEIKKNTEALETATGVREKEAAEFTAEEKEAVVSINQLKNAVVALSKAHEASLLKKNSKVGTADLQTESAAISHPKKKLDPNFAKQIEAEALRAHMQGILYRHPYEFVRSFLQVNSKLVEPAHRHRIMALLQEKDQIWHFPTWESPPADVPDASKKGEFLQSSDNSGRSGRSLGGKFANKIREFAHDLAVEKEEHPSAFAPASHSFSASALRSELPAPIQSLLSKVLKGVDTGFLESGMDDSDTGNTKYEPASGAIFGVLKQMKEDFEINLEQSQQAEAKASDEYDKLKAAKEEEIATATDSVNTKTDELAATDEKNAEDKEIKSDTEASLASDQAFMADLKERCASMDEEFEERTKGRQLEIEAVTKALAFLNSDEAHDLFTRTFNPVFLQVNTKTQSRLSVTKTLKVGSGEVKSVSRLRLRRRGMMVPGAFDAVTSSIGEMIDKLKREGLDEIKERDYCIETIDANERDIAHKERDLDDLTAHIDDLKMTIATLDKEIETLKAEIEELEIELKAATENRKKETEAFEVTVSDQRATQKLLAVALKILSDFYTFVQTDEKGQKAAAGQAAGQAPPPGFKKYEKSASSGGVMGMMEGIITDAKAMEAECIRAEEKAQKDFESMSKDTREAVETKTSDINTKSEDKAKAEEDKVQADTDMEATLTELEQLINEKADLHKKCDFLLANFEVTQAARNNEIEGLRQATDVFSGASFSDVHR